MTKLDKIETEDPKLKSMKALTSIRSVGPTTAAKMYAEGIKTIE